MSTLWHLLGSSGNGDLQGMVDLPISLVELKRRVYEKLDEEYRASGTIQPYDY
jgi:hypothetical protein